MLLWDPLFLNVMPYDEASLTSNEVFSTNGEELQRVAKSIQTFIVGLIANSKTRNIIGQQALISLKTYG